MTIVHAAENMNTELIDENQIGKHQLRTRLRSKNLQPLKYVCYALNLPTTILQPLQDSHIPARKKEDFMQLLN
jgi:hypothetical protein